MTLREPSNLALTAGDREVKGLVDSGNQRVGRLVDCHRHRTRRVVELSGDLAHAQTGKYLWIVLRPGQDVVIVDIQERHCAGLVSAIDEWRNVIAIDQRCVELGRRLQWSAGVVGQLGGPEGEIGTVECRASKGEGRGTGKDVGRGRCCRAEVMPSTEMRK